ncbi:hypothetical protein DPMN_124008 [Dreissena polymorpha]|uniref:Myb/SANT-like DNA-binding domain-containing protein n=1 Tax=Dreissena polymorpha TaxID=45954 RepID=A0A9D4GRZ6_DREPO|nr:hypothetical protein DPMN_124008 [Dreissena polymorpha]
MIGEEKEENRQQEVPYHVEQTTVLVERCVDGYNLLTSAHKLGLSESDKDSYWAETIEMINAVGPERSLVEAKRKWIEVKEHKPITCKQGQKPITGEQGQKPITGEQGQKPITGEHGKKPIMSEKGQKRKYESKCFVYLIKNNNY